MVEGAAVGPAGAEGKSPALVRETARRRTFAIISHPDAGKTTLTEKLLLYGGAIHLAGSVKARRAERHVTSDWMELERQRGISVTSSVLQFDYEGYRINLLDTPGHEDFSEDTYRTLVAADSAVMLLDNRRGVEERTRQLFEVCKRRRTPIFTFVNKCDRAGEEPLKLLSDIEADLGIACYPATWPIYRGGAFVGVYDRRGRGVHLNAPQQFLARERSAVEEAWPGDVIGVVDKGLLRIGDTLSGNGELEFDAIPRFAPEHFARISVSDPLRRKRLDAGVRQLTEEGAAQVFYAESEAGPAPVIGAVGLLQFDVMLHRLEHEYGAPCRLDRIPYRFPRWVTGPSADLERVARGRGRLLLYDAAGNSVMLFEDAWALRHTIEHERSLTFHEVAP